MQPTALSHTSRRCIRWYSFVTFDSAPCTHCQVYPIWDRTKVAAENVTSGYSFITPEATKLGQPDFSLLASTFTMRLHLSVSSTLNMLHSQLRDACII